MPRILLVTIVASLLAFVPALCLAENPPPPTVLTPPSPTVAPFNAASIPEPAVAQADPAGRRYAPLTNREKSMLRRGFKLPMAALTKARSVSALRKAVRLAALPDPSRPILAVASPADEPSGNPFGGVAQTAFRDNPMRALGERLGASAESDSQALGAGDLSTSDQATSGGVDPFGSTASGEEDPFGDSSGGAADDEADGADPFGEEDDPFAEGGDPFGL